MNAQTADNPLLAAWDAPFGAPPLDRVRPEHFAPAFERALAEHRAEIDAIAGEAAEPSFENTVAALERSGRLLARVSNVFYVLAGAHTNEAIQAIERDMAPLLARHWNEIHLNEKLFARLDALHRRPNGLTAEQARVLERYHAMFRRAGAGLDAAAKQRLKEIAERLATPRHDVRPERARRRAVLCDAARRGRSRRAAGFRPRGGARALPTERGLEGPARRDAGPLQRRAVPAVFRAGATLREKAFRAWIARGDNGGATDNKPVIAEMTALRDERARLLGYPSFAHYKLDDTMAKTPAAVTGLLDAVWAPGAPPRRRGARRPAGDGRGRGRELLASRRGTGATTPRSCARRASISTRARSSRTCRSTASSRRRSTRRTACSA